MSLLNTFIGVLAPHDCLTCGQEGALLCSDCLTALPSAPPYDHGLLALDGIKSRTHYTGTAKDLIWQLKSAGAQAAAATMARAMSSLLAADQNLIIVPVPTVSSRIRQRGYDQAKLLARALSRTTSLPYLDCLDRTGKIHQVGAGRDQRLRQTRGTLRIKRPRLIAGADLLLVDDVVTTGATLEVAAAILKSAGAHRVSALTFAQAYNAPKQKTPAL